MMRDHKIRKLGKSPRAPKRAHSQAENDIAFFPTAPLGAVPYFEKTGNTVKWGKKFDFTKWHRKYAL